MLIPIIIVVVLIVVFIATQTSLLSSKSGDEQQVVRKASVCESPYEDIPIYFSSQTGTAERFCDLLKEDGKEFNLSMKVINLEDFDEEEFMKSKFTIFMLATHYEGDPPDNAVTWTDDFIKAEGKPSLSHMKFLMYGLGDKTYKHFGGYAHTVKDELLKRGATSVKELEIGSDHQNRIEDHFVEWKEGIFAKIRSELPFKAGQEIIEGSAEDVFSPSSPKKTNLYAPKFNIKSSDESAKIISPVDWRSTYNASNFELNSGKIVEAFESRVLKCQDIRQKEGYTGKHVTGKSLELDLEVPEGLNVDTAGNLVIYPENDDQIVNSILKRVGLDSWTIIELQKNPAQDGNNKMPFPSPIMAGEVVKRFIDLTGILKVSTLKKLAKVVNNFETKEALTKIAEKQNKDFINMTNQNWGLFNLIENYNIDLSLEELVDISDRIKPRFYTIASSKRVNPKVVSICITLSIDHLKDFDKTHYGLTSKKCCDIQDKLKRGNTTLLRLNHQPSTFHLPTDINTNCLMIGSGAGVGPFIGMLDEKVHDIDNCEDSNYGQMTLFFGIRDSQEDFLYKDKLKSQEERGILNKLHMAVSRENAQKVYVQDQLAQNKDLLKDTIFNGGRVYCCGNMGMANAVRKVIENCVSEKLGISISDAEDKVDSMIKKDKIISIEAWG